MANVKISDLPVASAVQDTDEIVVSQGTGENDVKSSTLAVLRTWINSGETSSAGVTANNGLTENAGNIQLGGALTQNTNINLDGSSLAIQGNTFTSIGISTTDAYLLGGSGTDWQNYVNSYIDLTDNRLNIARNRAVASVGASQCIQFTDESGMLVLDTFQHKGFVYYEDYSAAGTLNDRWIPDYGAVKAYVASAGSSGGGSSVAAGNGLTDTSGTITLGGALSQDTTIDNSAHSLTFTNTINIQELSLGKGANGNSSNVAFGNQALAVNGTGSQQNTAIGQFTMSSNTTGAFNTGVGAQALATASTGDNNTGVGNYALTFLTTGSNNTGIGSSALGQATGSNNTAIGFGAGASAAGNGNIFLGCQAGNAETGSNKLYVANSATTTPLLYGDFGTSALTINGTLSATGQLSAPAVANSAAQTSVSGSTSGAAVFSQPEQGASYKKVLIYFNALVGSASYTFPAAFVNTPSLMAPASMTVPSVTSLSTTGITFSSSAATTGFIELIGY